LRSTRLHAFEATYFCAAAGEDVAKTRTKRSARDRLEGEEAEALAALAIVGRSDDGGCIALPCDKLAMRNLSASGSGSGLCRAWLITHGLKFEIPSGRAVEVAMEVGGTAVD
jgi:hypothetical protein